MKIKGICFELRVRSLCFTTFKFRIATLLDF
jgi:hypothetical protein